ncbi:MAG: hypothetical protein ACPGXX_16080 [Planctomycetaceae bacterium]
MSTDRQNEIQSTEQPLAVNLVVWAGLGFTVLAIIIYFVLRQMLVQLPQDRVEFEEVRANASALTRLIFVGASGAMCNVVGLVLSLIGYVASAGSRGVALAGSIVSGVLLLGLFTIVLSSFLTG